MNKSKAKIGNLEIKQWVVFEGKPVFVCRTRKQARAEIERLSCLNQRCLNATKQHCWRYVGKSVNNHHNIILDC